MKPISLFIALFFLQKLAFAQDKFLQEANQKWKSATEYTQKVMDVMPHKHFGFKPMKDEMSFEEQLLHMANNMNWLGATYLTSKPAPSTIKLEAKGKSRKEVMQDLNNSMAYIHDILSNFDSNKLDELVDFPAGKLTKRQIITLLNDHQTHHRAQLLVYLRLKGEKPPAYVGW
jgi:uncharacterized damage-inducible protein DinB